MREKTTKSTLLLGDVSVQGQVAEKERRPGLSSMAAPRDTAVRLRSRARRGARLERFQTRSVLGLAHNANSAKLASHDTSSHWDAVNEMLKWLLTMRATAFFDSNCSIFQAYNSKQLKASLKLIRSNLTHTMHVTREGNKWVIQGHTGKLLKSLSTECAAGFSGAWRQPAPTQAWQADWAEEQLAEVGLNCLSRKQ